MSLKGRSASLWPSSHRVGSAGAVTGGVFAGQAAYRPRARALRDGMGFVSIWVCHLGFGPLKISVCLLGSLKNPPQRGTLPPTNMAPDRGSLQKETQLPSTSPQVPS